MIYSKLLVGFLLALGVLLPSSAFGQRAESEHPSAPEPRPVYWSEADRASLSEHLRRSRDLVIDEVRGLSEAQWHYKPANEQWSIAENVEHLAVIEDFYYKEGANTALNEPPMEDLRDRVRGREPQILAYANDRHLKGESSPVHEPNGRWSTPERLLEEFERSRERTISFVESTDADLRSHFVFRSGSWDDRWRIRDVHQYLLTASVHAERHVHQMREIKADPEFPESTPEIPASIEGAWQLISAQWGPDKTYTRDSTIVVTKLFAGSRVAFAYYDGENGGFEGAGGGTYRLDGDRLTESVAYFSWDPTAVGQEYSFRIRLDGHRLYQFGEIDSDEYSSYRIEEIWQRIRE